MTTKQRCICICIEKTDKNKQIQIILKRNLTQYKLRLDQDPLYFIIQDIIKKKKKNICNFYTFYVAHDNPQKNFILNALKADIKYLTESKKIFFFGLITEGPQGFFITFYLNKKANTFYRNPFINVYKYIDYEYKRYLIYNIKKPFIFVKSLTKAYVLKKIKEYAFYVYRYLYYIAHEIEIIKSIDNSHPILFVQKWFRKIKTFLNLSSALLFDRNPWERDRKFMNLIIKDFYSEEIVIEVWYKRWFNTLYYKIDKILMQTTYGAAKEEFKDQFIFFVPSEEESIFDISLKGNIAIFRTDISTNETNDSLEKLGVDSKIIGSKEFNHIKEKYKVK